MTGSQVTPSLPAIRTYQSEPRTNLFRQTFSEPVHNIMDRMNGSGEPPTFYNGQNLAIDNSDLCDILMLERALENEAVAHSTDNKVDMLEIPGKGRCYVYLAR